MSKFPNQLALVSVVGVSAIALSVGLSERAANKAAIAAHEAAMATAQHAAVPHEAPPAETVTEAVEPAAEAAPVETVEAAPEAAAPAAAVAVVDGSTDTLDGQGDTDVMAGDDTAAPMGKIGLGRPALPEEVAAWNHDILPDGTGLPDGEGDVWTGEEVFADNCAVCHGDFAEGVDNWPKLAGGMNTLNREDPLKTVGSYWPYLSTAFDYVRRSMPFGAAQTMSDDDVYAIVAYILFSNDLVDEDFVLSKDTFFDVEMPNADGFIIDDRAETELGLFSAEPCMENCKESVEITMRAAVLDVTPDHGGDDEAAAEEAPAETEMAAAESTPADEAPVVQAAAEEAAPVATEEPAAEETAAVDPALVADGEKVFKKCKACHQVGEDAKNKVGPILNGIVGRAAGTGDDFKYSNAMIEAGEGGLVWNDETLAGYLEAPKKYIKGNKMSFAGLKKADDIAAITAYLKAHP
ncbi:sulfur dehydrogenase subunit SoxD [Aliiruegeria lutimaris]|uniref:Sulfur dehydrogenase subunit SoxD n=2 Tax=Aliiruegeria lutimaris TaxID=571298 RepID=A0A1G9LIV2_9RHOB|nr:sulfur dehydrogenase subunit SoxD [Aliiruegeria lutimaris]